MSITEHPREKFDGYAKELALGDWAYNVDDFEVAYGPGLWPFHRLLETVDRSGSEPVLRVWETGVRLAPSLAYYAWRNEYVMLWPDLDQSVGPREGITRARADLNLWVRPQRMGGLTVRCTVDIDLATGAFTLNHGDIDGELRRQAEVKAGRVVELLAVERARRDTAPAPLGPLTAHQRYTAAVGR